MRKISYFLILFCLISSSSFGFNRNQIHTDRLISFDLKNRTTPNEHLLSRVLESTGSSDILISESTAPAKFKQDFSDIVGINDSLNLVVFSDERMGSSKIFGQLVDKAGLHIGSNFLIAGSPVGSDFVDPKVERDSNNRILLLYRDRSAGLIYAARYNSDWTVDVPEFLINDSSMGAYAGPFDLTLYSDSKFAVVWENYFDGANSIIMNLYNENGTALTSSIRVNSNSTAVSRWVPSIALDPTGNIIVAWEDYRNLQADIYIRLFNGAGIALGNDVALVPSPYNTANQYAPEIVFVKDHTFLIGWIDKRDGQEIYGQLYSVTTGLIGSNQIISDPNPLAINWNLDLASDSIDFIAAVYASFGSQNSILLQKLNSLLARIGPPVIINQSSSGGRWEPAVLFQSGYNVISWTEHQDDHSDILMNLFNPDFSSSLAGEMIVNDDSLGATSSHPAITASSDWYKLIVFEDKRFDQGDIFIQAITNDGSKFYANHKANQDLSNNLQAEPAIAASIASEIALVVWVDSRDVAAVPGQRIYGRLCDKFGLFTSDEFMISAPNKTAVKNSPKTAIAPSGETIVAWLDNRFSKPAVMAQRVSSSGDLIGSEFLVSDTALETTIGQLRVAVDLSANFYLFWSELKALDPVIKMKKYSNSGSLLLALEWASPTTGVTIDQFDAAVSGTGEFAVTFSNPELSSELYLVHFDNSGIPIGSLQKISDGLNPDVSDPALSISNNDYLSLCWVDRRNGKREVMYQILDNNFTKLGVNQIVSFANPEFMITPVTNAVFGRAFYVWVDPSENGCNVYGSTVIYLPTDIDDGSQPVIPKQYILHQNYPNPFNPATSIMFSLPEKASVKLAVYNMLGQEVKILLNQEMEAGNHLVDWDGTNSLKQKVASGLYFYKLISENYSGMKKMLLVK